MYIITLTYKKPMEEIEKVTADHRAFLDTLYTQDVLLASGPQVPRTGGILIARSGRSKEEVMEILKQDPFYIADVADYSIIEFNPMKYHANLKDIL